MMSSLMVDVAVASSLQTGARKQRASSPVNLRGCSGEEEDADGFSQGDMRALQTRVAQAREDALALPGPDATPEQVISQTLHLLVSRRASLQGRDLPLAAAGLVFRDVSR